MRKRISSRSLQLSLLQSAAAAVFIFIAFLCTSAIDNALLLTTLGASAFILFAFPKAESARARYLLGGYICAVIVGSAFSFVIARLELHTGIGITLCCVGAVFVVMLLMTVFDFEHPPSVAVAITVTISDKPLWIAAVAIVSIIILCLCRRPFIALIDKLGFTKELVETIKNPQKEEAAAPPEAVSAAENGRE